MKKLITILLALFLLVSCTKIPCLVCDTTSTTIPHVLDSIINKDYDYSYTKIWIGTYTDEDIKRIEAEGTKTRVVALPPNTPVMIDSIVYDDLVLNLTIQTTTKCYRNE